MKQDSVPAIATMLLWIWKHTMFSVFLQPLNTRLDIDFQITSLISVCCIKVQGGSANMEPFACKTLLTSLVKDFQLAISSFTSDRSSSISVYINLDSK